MEVSPGKTPLGSDSINAAKKDHEAAAEDDEMTHTEDLVFSPYVCQVCMPFRFIRSSAFLIKKATYTAFVRIRVALLSTAPLPPCTYPVDAFPTELIEQGKLT
ncbi:hypothetical protein DYB38_003888, partial [Aphanomyces astaci]